MDVLRQDIRGAFVAMRRAPGFAATALLTLALGIGATTAVFSIVHGVLLRPLPYAEPERLVRVWEEHPGGTSAAGNRWLSRPTYAVWREQSRTLDAIGGFSLYERQLDFGGDAERVKAFTSFVSPAVLATLGATATPALGRFFVDEDDRENAPRVAVLSDALWRERYAANPQIIGLPLIVDDDTYTIVGVARPSFDFPDPRVRVWMPYRIPRVSAQDAGTVVFTALARLKPGATLAQVEAEGTAAARAAPKHRLTELFFGKGGPAVVHVRRLADDITAPARPALSVLAVAVALVLLIACANVANLLLSRGVTRRRELAIRAAVGGSRARLARQLFTESAVFAIVGGALGLWLAWWLVRVLPVIAPATLPRLDAIALDGTVVMFCALVTCLAAIAAGLAPAARGARVDLSDALRSPDGSSTSGFRGASARRLRDGLLVVEAAFAVILIVGAGLLARSFVRLIHVDNGYTAEPVLVAGAGLPRGATEAQTERFIDAALPRLRAMRGVSAAGASTMIPLMRATAVGPFTLPESLTGGKPTHGRALVYWITPGYAEALGLRLRDGRFFVESDRTASERRLPVIVNEEFVRRHLAVPYARDVRKAVGLTLPDFVPAEAPNQLATAEIVGVVGNVLKDGNDRQPQPELYFVHGSRFRMSGHVNFIIRTASAAGSASTPAAIAPDVRALLRQIEPTVTVDRIEPLTATLAASMDAPRFAASVMASFAGVAMVLAAIGLYGVLSYSVSQRIRELGIRAALGASRVALVGLVLREGLSVTCVGIALGVVGASVFTRLMQELLFGVTPLDMVAFTVAPAILIVAALGACFGPAWRAASTDPALTLRGQ